MRILLSNEEIVKISQDIAKKITIDYRGKVPIIACVLKGAAPFHSELIKHIDLDMVLDYIQVSSYNGTESMGVLTLKKDLEFDIKGKDVILVEDIVDTGTTLAWLKEELLKREPASLKIVTLLSKPSRRKIDIEADYVGKVIDDLFVIGFGLDLDEKYRNLKDICVFDNDQKIAKK